MHKKLIAIKQRRFVTAMCLVIALSFLSIAPAAIAQETINMEAATSPKGSVAKPVIETTAPSDAPVDTHEDAWNLHAQSTYVTQRKNSFYAPYSLTTPAGQSLSTQRERSYSMTETLYLGARLWKGAEIYVNPEAVQGLALSSLYGLAGVQNGELQKNGGVVQRGYWARAFARQTVNLGGELFHVDDAANQMASNYNKRRIVLTLGKIVQTDLFERSSYANDPRTQFLNWATITHGAWDFAGDARSYSVGGAAELYWDDWAFRIGRYMEPAEANGKYLDYNIARHHGDVIEFEHTHAIGELPGTIRVLAFRNYAFAGNYRDAINAIAALPGVAPDVTTVRKDSAKIGFGVSFEQNITKDIGVFARGSYADAKVEEFAFAEIDNTVSAGVVSKGSKWGRPDDVVGLAYVKNGLNRDHREYLALGGIGGFIGDGQLTYRPERIVELYYNVKLFKGANFTVDYQHISNPAYNEDRHGPVTVIGARLHFEL